MLEEQSKIHYSAERGERDVIMGFPHPSAKEGDGINKSGLTIVMILSRWQGHRARRGLYRGLLLRTALRRTGGVGGCRTGGRRRVFMFWRCHLMAAATATLVSQKIT